MGGFILALIVVLRLFSERRSPGSTLAWLLLIFFAPYIGVPLYLLLGGRKSRRLVKQKKVIRALIADVSHVEKKDQKPSFLWTNVQFPGHQFKLLPSGFFCWEQLLHQVNSAQKSICIATFIFGRDAIGKTLLQKLVEKAKAGVEVKIMVDALGSFWVNRRFFKPLIEAGGEVAFFMPMLPLQTKMSSNLRNHRKIAIFDYNIVIAGGQNLDDRFLSLCHEKSTFVDFSAEIQGPCVADFNRMFISDWCFAKKQPVEKFANILQYTPPYVGDESIEVVPSGPDMEKDLLWEILMTAIQNAQSNICIVTPYFLPDVGLFHSLLIKARSGRKITLMIPQKSNQILVDVAREGILRELHHAGVRILLHTGPMLHAKLFLVDDALGMMGSANFDLRSLFVNFEVGILLKSPNSLQALKIWADGLKTHCIPYEVNYQITDFRKWKEDLAHVIAPLL